MFEEGAVKTLDTDVRKYTMDLIAIQETYIKDITTTNLERDIFLNW